MEVTEPTQRRELVEADTNAQLRTRWTIEPLTTGRCRVHVETSWADAGGVAGWFERLLAPRSLRRTHEHTLDRLARQIPA